MFHYKVQVGYSTDFHGCRCWPLQTLEPSKSNRATNKVTSARNVVFPCRNPSNTNNEQPLQYWLSVLTFTDPRTLKINQGHEIKLCQQEIIRYSYAENPGNTNSEQPDPYEQLHLTTYSSSSRWAQCVMPSARRATLESLMPQPPRLHVCVCTPCSKQL